LERSSWAYLDKVTVHDTPEENAVAERLRLCRELTTFRLVYTQFPLKVIRQQAHQFPPPCASCSMPSFFANLTRRFSRSTVIATSSHPPVPSKSKNRFYAYQKKIEWDLPSSEEKEAVERTLQAVRDNASQIRGAFREDRDVDWVIM
jgi:hypothetical protein